MMSALNSSGRSLEVLILATDGDTASADARPCCLAEVDGVPLIERIVGWLTPLAPEGVHFVFTADHVRLFHLDDVAALVQPGARVVQVPRDTQGAACAVMLAAADLDHEAELLCISANELVDADLRQVLQDWRHRSLDAGTLSFHSEHPLDSFVRLDEEGLVQEVAQRNPISVHATTELVWFRRVADLMAAAQSMIRKDAHVGGRFHLCPVLNELLLVGLRVGVTALDSGSYHPLKDAHQVARFQSCTPGVVAGRLEDMVKGWFVGDFSPTLLATCACEVAVKHYKVGDYENTHHHRVATELTLVLEGRVRMAGREWGRGDIVVLSPGVATDFVALTDAVSVVVKVPGARDDKYPGLPSSRQLA